MCADVWAFICFGSYRAYAHTHDDDADKSGAPLCLTRPPSVSAELTTFCRLVVDGESSKMRQGRDGTGNAVVRLGEVKFRAAHVQLLVVETKGRRYL